MKKFFLIPLITLVCSVMAWADNVAKIGDTEYATVAAAIADAENGATITLLANAGGDVTLSKDITFNGDKKFTGNITIGASEVTLTLAGVTIDVTGNDAIVHLGKTLNVVAAEGTTNAIYAKSSGCDCFYGISNGRLNISGNGTLEVYGNEAIHVSYMNLSAPNATYGASGTLMYTPQIVSATISAGTFDREFPDSYVSAPLFIEKVSSSYVVSNIGANKAVYNYAAYASLQAAVDAAAVGATIVMYADDAAAVTVDKPLTIVKNGHSINTSAGSGIALKEETGSSICYIYQSLKDFVDFMTAAGTNSLVVTEDLDLSTVGQIVVKGTKTITINSGVKILYKRQSAGANILVPVGAKLTILGSGTFQPANGTAIETNSTASAQVGNRAIDIDGELVIGIKDDADNQPHFITTSIARGSAITTNSNGVVTINNADVQAANYAIWNEGTMYINGGTYVSTATYLNGINTGWYGYCIRNQAKMILKNAKVVGNHGAVSCENTPGTMEIRNCDLQARNLTGKGGVHYALYVCTHAMVSVYDTKFYSENDGYTIYIGNNDAYHSFGLIYLYDGCKSNRKMFVQKKKNTDDQILFPVLVSEESAWYKVATRTDGYVGNDDRLLPANVAYNAIDEQVYDINGDPIEGAKYLFGVVSTAEETKDATGTTIPWQQATTWTDTPTGDDVPEATTAVVIPEGKEVVISNDPAIIGTGVDKDTAAVAEQIFLGEGAKLTVKTGTTLTVGEGGINVANGGQVVVEPGAIVTVGATGLVTSEEEALVIEATEEDQGVFLLQPDVTENTQPKATVKLVTKCKQKAAGEYVWERFAIPTLDGEETTFSIEGGTTGIITYDGGAFQQGLYGWSDAEQDWVGLSRFKDMKPFKGYQLSNNSRDAGVTYVFEGNLVGNTDQNYQFAQTGFGFFGNSYTGDIDILKFFESFDENMQKTIWIYDYYTDGFKAITANNYGTVYYGTRKARHGAITDIRSMQAFLMNTFAEGQSVQNVDYSAAIWGNPKYGLVAAPAPKRVLANNNEDKVTIYVATDKSEDEITFIRSNEYSAEFDNGADASKWMNSDFNLYAVTDNGELAVVASDEIVDMTIAFKSGKETEYTLGFDNLRGEQFELRDVLTGATIQMMEGVTYTFSQEANTTIPARFQILGAKKVATDIENVEEGANVQQKVVKNGVLYILRDNKWYNAQGQLVK